MGRSHIFLIFLFFQSFSLAYGTVIQAPSVQEHLGIGVRGELYPFRDEDGQRVVLSEYFRPGQPVILAPVYYECPSLCNLTLNNLVSAMKPLRKRLGQDFQLVAVSINPTETPALAKVKRTAYFNMLGKPDTLGGWHFLVGNFEEIRPLTDRLGFRYTYDEKTRQYNHPAVLVILTPLGKISSYLYGLSFDADTLEEALTAASRGDTTSIGEKILMFCGEINPLGFMAPTNRRSPGARYGFLRVTFLVVLASGISACLFFGIRRWRKRSLTTLP